jgi:hypothetical protein
MAPVLHSWARLCRVWNHQIGLTICDVFIVAIMRRRDGCVFSNGLLEIMIIMVLLWRYLIRWWWHKVAWGWGKVAVTCLGLNWTLRRDRWRKCRRDRIRDHDALGSHHRLVHRHPWHSILWHGINHDRGWSRWRWYSGGYYCRNKRDPRRQDRRVW